VAAPQTTTTGSGSTTIDFIKELNPTKALEAVLSANEAELRYVWGRGGWTILMQASDYGYASLVKEIPHWTECALPGRMS
jgi:hypothetical protein